MKIPCWTRQKWLDAGLVAALLVAAYFALFFQLGSTLRIGARHATSQH